MRIANFTDRAFQARAESMANALPAHNVEQLIAHCANFRCKCALTTRAHEVVFATRCKPRRVPAKVRIFKDVDAEPHCQFETNPLGANDNRLTLRTSDRVRAFSEIAFHCSSENRYRKPNLAGILAEIVAPRAHRIA